MKQLPQLTNIINQQDAGDIVLINTLPPAPIDQLISQHYPAYLFRLAADVVGYDNELARRLVARGLAVMSYRWKQERLGRLLNEQSACT